MTGLDVEAVLSQHRYRPDTDGRGGCTCGELPDDIQEWTVEADHRVHVAAVLRVEIAEWLGRSTVSAAMDDETLALVIPLSVAVSDLYPYRPTLAATEGD